MSAAHPGLEVFGVTPAVTALAAAHPSHMRLGRVVRSDRGMAFVATRDGLVAARPSTRLIRSADDGVLPVVGDWVLIGGDGSEPLVEVVLERTTAIVRRDPGRSARAQVLAANVDTVLITDSLASGPNLSRIERELALVWDSGARPVVVLTKADLSSDAKAARSAVEGVAPGVDVHVTSTVDHDGIDGLQEYLAGGGTIALIGPSGSGKSTLVNELAGEDIRATRDVRLSDGRGRHTTVSRELIPLPGGGLVIDTPGLRAVGMWDSADGLAQAFSDIEEFAAGCRFRDCRHEDEPGCAVRDAVERGELPSRRLASFRELQAEIAHVNVEIDVRARQDRKHEDKVQARAIKNYHKQGQGHG